MYLFTLNHNGSAFTVPSEVFTIKAGLLVAKVFNAISDDINLLKMLNDLPSRNDHFIITAFHTFFNRFDENITPEGGAAFDKRLKALRNKKGKQRGEVIEQGRMETIVRTMKKDVENYLSEYLKHINILELKDFIASDALGSHGWQEASQMFDSRMFQFIIHGFGATDFYYIFDGSILNAPETAIFHSIPLLRIPDLNSLAYAQLNLLKNDFNERLSPFYEAIENLQKEMNKGLDKEDQTAQNIEKMEAFINPQLPMLEALTSNNPYLQQIHLNQESVLVKQLNLGLTSIKNIVQFWVHQKLFNEDQARYILESVDQRTPVDTQLLFFYLEDLL